MSSSLPVVSKTDEQRWSEWLDRGRPMPLCVSRQRTPRDSQTMPHMTIIGFCPPPSVPGAVADQTLRLAICPLCHTTDAIATMSAIDAGGSWRCGICHQNWSARRLATVAAYAAWSREHDGAQRA